MITIENLRTTKMANPWDVKIDRSSILANPFFMDGEDTRNKVCDSFEKYFVSTLEEHSSRSILIKEELYRLMQLHKEFGQLRLFCWCSPKRCHAETIKKYLEGELKLDG